MSCDASHSELRCDKLQLLGFSTATFNVTGRVFLLRASWPLNFEICVNWVIVVYEPRVVQRVHCASERCVTGEASALDGSEAQIAPDEKIDRDNSR